MTRANPRKNSLPSRRVGDARRARRTTRRRRMGRAVAPQHDHAGGGVARPTLVIARRAPQQRAGKRVALGVGEADGADAVGDRDDTSPPATAVPVNGWPGEHPWKYTRGRDRRCRCCPILRWRCTFQCREKPLLGFTFTPLSRPARGHLESTA